MNSIDFYDRNADAFFGDTAATNMESIYNRFLPLVKSGGSILDAGCGSGRDSLAFIQRGYSVDAFDGSAEMVHRARALTGIPVKQLLFEDLLKRPMQKRYDAIWCCASLLHVQRHALPPVLEALLDMLMPQGVMYLSFKHGESDRTKDGRWFTDLTEESLVQVLKSVGRCKVVQGWITKDQRPGRTDTWLNAIVQSTVLIEQEQKW